MDKDIDSFTYNTSGQVTCDSIYSYNSSKSKVTLANRKMWTYNTDGTKNTLYEAQADASFKFSDSYRETYSYASGNRTLSYNEDYQTGTGKWVPTSVDSTSYDGSGYPYTISYLYDYIIVHGWVRRSREYCGTAMAGTAPAAPSGLTVVAMHKTNDKKLQLSWTDNSSNESGFIIYRSTDGTTWTAIDSTAANATSYTDTALAPASTYYYEVAAWNGAGVSAKSSSANATTFTGIYSSSDAVEVNIFPNPSKGNFTLKFSGSVNEETTLIIRDQLGKTVYIAKVSSGINSMNCSLEHLPQGMYILSLTGEKYSSITKMIIEK